MSVLPRFAGEARRCVALPLGGLGAGHVAICGDGTLRQWQLHNRPNHLGYVPQSFFALRTSVVEPPRNVQRLLQSPPLDAPRAPAPNVTDHLVPWDADMPAAHWPRVASTVFEGAYPFARISYEDPELPVAAELEAFTPFVPLDADASGLPLASFSFTLHNPSVELVHGWLLATLQNAVGWDGATPIAGERCGLYGGNVNRTIRRPESTAIVMDNPSLAEDDPFAGEMALWTSAPCVALPRFARTADALRFVESLKLLRPTIDGDWSEVGLRRACAELPPLLRVPTGPSPGGATWSGALAAAVALAPGATTTVEFVIAWRFPNRRADFDGFGVRARSPDTALPIGNAYATRFGSVLDVVDHYSRERRTLRERSRAWAESFATSTLPDVVADVLLAQGSLVRSPTTFRTSDGRLFGFEGSLGSSTLNWNGSLGGSCPLNCNHVWNYEQAISRLFPELERTMRDTELEFTQHATGYLPHRVVLPLWLTQLHGVPIGGPDAPALDGMLGAILKCYRELRQGADPEWLRSVWGRLERLFAFIDANWNVAGDGVLVGEQPITYDIALNGANIFVGGLWLAALRAMEEMARHVAPGASRGYADLFARASERYDALLYNGEYYAQLAADTAHEFGSGCLADQLVGQWWAHQLELGYLLPRERVRSSLRAVVRHNLRTGFEGFEHGYRTFADGDDSGLLVCTWPRGDRPAQPIRYCNEVWTGVEYQVAAHCFMEGLHDEGIQLLRAVRGRYDGTRRNPYNEIECGDHYARAMSGWSVLEAVTGFRYDATADRIALRDEPARFPFVTGSGWGTIEVRRDGVVEIVCLGGRLDCRRLELVADDGTTSRVLSLDRAITAPDRILVGQAL